jgi:hypothetical protein
MRTKILIIFILALAFVLRVWAINIIPSGFTPDEASFGYDAYSILETGKDQWGHTVPLSLESFGDFKLPLYSYLTVPSVAVFGLTKFAVRLPNALVGTLAVWVTYLLVNLLLVREDSKKSFWVAGFAAGLLAISPWHVMMSRGAFEANLTTLLMPLGIYLFLLGLKRNKYLLLSSVVFGLNLFSYHSARLVTPIILLALLWFFRKQLKGGLVRYKLPILVFLIFLVGAFYTLLGGGARRAQDITIFSGALNQASDERFTAMYQGMSEGTARLFHNKYLVVAKRFFENYTQYTSYNFWFINGPAEGTYGMIPGYGVLYLFELPLLIGFLYSFFFLKDRNSFWIVLLWILIAPIPAALTTGRGYAGNRSVIMLPGLTIASAFGAYAIYTFSQDKFGRRITKIVSFAFLVFTVPFFASFLEKYFVLSPFENSASMLYGNLEVAQWLSKNSDTKNEVVISRSLSEPHIYIAFANKWAPKDFQENSKFWQVYRQQGLKFLDQLESYNLGKYTFTSIDYKKYQERQDVLLVGRPNEFPPTARSLIEFVNPDGSVAVEVVEPFNQAYATQYDQKDSAVLASE